MWGPSCNARYLKPLETAVLTSATLAVGGGFDYMRRRLGLEHVREVVLPLALRLSEAGAVLRSSRPARSAHSAICRQGGGPCPTAYSRSHADAPSCSLPATRSMNEVYQRLLGELEFPMLLQGDAPKSALLEEFRLTPHAVLFATSSFWQGVDVQGQQLSCVIIDRLPFAVPSDPVVAARVKSIDA